MKRPRTLAEPFKIKMVEPLKITTETYRKTQLAKAYNNPFLLKSEDVFVDLLTDSGTGAMSEQQWSAMMLGDESYAGASSWEKLETEVKDLTQMPFVIPTHQGRAAERILYGILGGKDKVFISNTHFDTTRANIEFTGAQAFDVIYEEAKDPQKEMPFKGDLNVEAADAIIQKFGADRIGAIVLTITNNSAGGQPVSYKNALAVRALCDKYGLLLVLDACRIAENSYFVKHREAGFENQTYREIGTAFLRLGDAFIMSAKKDGLVNMGGLLTLKDKKLAEQCMNLLIISEGFVTYGGLSGRDMEALAVGLQEVFDDDYLHYRIKSTEYLGRYLNELGIPTVKPYGGHAIYVDAKAFYSHIAPHEYPGQSLVCDLYVKGGIRCCEIGSVMFGKTDAQGNFVPAQFELVRLAIPRRVYTQSHIDYVIDIFAELSEEKQASKGMKITYEPPFLRHFTAHFERVE